MLKKHVYFLPHYFYRTLCIFSQCECDYHWHQSDLSRWAKNVIVKLENNDDSAALVQAWIDNGNPNADPKYTKPLL